MNVQSVLSSDASSQLVRPLTDDEVSAVNGGFLVIGAIAYIYNTAQSSTGGNSDISSWAAA